MLQRIDVSMHSTILCIDKEPWVPVFHVVVVRGNHNDFFRVRGRDGSDHVSVDGAGHHEAIIVVRMLANLRRKW